MRKLLAVAVIAAGAFGMAGAQAAPGDNGTVVYSSGFYNDTSSTFTVDAGTTVRGVVNSYSGTFKISHIVCDDPNDPTTCYEVIDWTQASGNFGSGTATFTPGIVYTLALTGSGYGFVAAGSPE